MAELNNSEHKAPEEWEIKFLGLVIRAKNPTVKGILILCITIIFLIIMALFSFKK